MTPETETPHTRSRRGGEIPLWGLTTQVHIRDSQPNLCFLQAKRSTQKSSNSLRGCFRILEKTQEDEFLYNKF